MHINSLPTKPILALETKGIFLIFVSLHSVNHNFFNFLGYIAIGGLVVFFK